MPCAMGTPSSSSFSSSIVLLCFRFSCFLPVFDILTFLYFGAGSTQAVVDAASLATTPVAAHAVMLFDGHTTDLSGRMQSERDRTTSDLEKWLDSPLTTAALLSLQGAKAVVCNLRPTPVEYNAMAIDQVFGELQAAKSLGAAVQTARKTWLNRSEDSNATDSHFSLGTIAVGLPHISMG